MSFEAGVPDAAASWLPARMPRHWDTSEVAPAEAFAYYREGICTAFMDLVPEDDRPRTGPFRAVVENRPLGSGTARGALNGGALNRVRASAHLVRRTRAEIAAAPDECFYLNLETQGECRIDQAGETVALRAGDVGIFSSSAPFALAHRAPRLAVASFWVPRAALADRLPRGLADRPQLLSGHPVLGALVRETALTLAEGAGHLPAADADRLFAMLIDLAAMVLAGPAPTRPGDRRSARAALGLAVRRHVARNAADPGLTLDGLAARFGLSRRSLQALFAAREESFSGVLLHCRLTAAAAALRHPAKAHLPIASLALAAGFADPAHFSRVFKARHGITPGSWRRGDGG